MADVANPSNGFRKSSLSSCFDLIERAGNSVRRVFLNHLDPQFGEAHVCVFLGLVNRAPGDTQLSGNFRFG
jgi:NAD(P)H-hydrate repair Nnr-like enzyme with NAD(P)H-hydrate epimerase domain